MCGEDLLLHVGFPLSLGTMHGISFSLLLAASQVTTDLVANLLGKAAKVCD
jgi:hypothetical protein